MTILEKIIAHKKKELVALKENSTVRDLENNKLFSRETLSLSDSILNPVRTGIIAEFKRKSPSKGIINSQAQVGEVTLGYARAGASGLSILTDRKFFGGGCDDLVLARELNVIPILRKDFIIDEFHVIESKAAGADAILLIAAVLGKNQVLKLASLSHSLNMEVLLEIHSPLELNMVNNFVKIIGVNNRDLNTFRVNTKISFDLADKIPEQFTRISESGISSPVVVRELRKAGYHGFLIGEIFMNNENPVSAFSDFAKEIL